jgi:hypothetical protein
VELDTTQQVPRLFGWEDLIERAGRMGRQIVGYDADALGLRIVGAGEFAHADGESRRCAALGDLDPASWPVGIEEDDRVGGAVAAVFAVVALDLSRFGCDRRPTSPINWIGLSSKHTTSRSRSGASA